MDQWVMCLWKSQLPVLEMYEERSVNQEVFGRRVGWFVTMFVSLTLVLGWRVIVEGASWFHSLNLWEKL